MSGLAIVAIPAPDEPVWKYSSEKIPHLTLLYFGDYKLGSDLETVSGFIQHTVNTSLPRFGLEVDRRGTLGSEDADVLFFNTKFCPEIREARSFLLSNPILSRAYHSTDQFPSWTPHLTMGYPATPANPDDRDYPGISWVNFDRLFLWTGDYDGIEYPLPSKDNLMSDNEMSMSEQIDDFLSHYGVKGMRWGVRKNDETPTSVSVSQSPGSRVKTSGGTNQPASDDAKRVAVSKQKARASTTDALSTKELQELVNRMNLEQQYSRLTQGQKSSGVKTAQSILKNTGKQELIQLAQGNPIPLGVQLAPKIADALKNRSEPKRDIVDDLIDSYSVNRG